jgi:AmmeMemoRadiSam system protein B
MGVLSSYKAKGRSPVVAGLFYPEEKEEIEVQLGALGLKSGAGGNAAAIIAPHGAWELSGAVAAAAFSAASGRARPGKSGKGISRVVILGNIHNYEEPGVFLSDSHFFETPLGRIPVEGDICESLASCSTLFQINDIPHLKESSLEVLLPMIQFCFPGVAIVPILMGGLQPRLVSALARALGLILQPLMDTALLVVSANIAIHEDEQTARFGAETCIRLLREKKNSEVIAGVYDGRISSCGGALIASLLESGLMADRSARLVSGPLITARDERGNTTCYAGIAFE